MPRSSSTTGHLRTAPGHYVPCRGHAAACCSRPMQSSRSPDAASFSTFGLKDHLHGVWSGMVCMSLEKCQRSPGLNLFFVKPVPDPIFLPWSPCPGAFRTGEGVKRPVLGSHKALRTRLQNVIWSIQQRSRARVVTSITTYRRYDVKIR